MTFPEYVTPHARDLLKRILVPDPRKRADLFEVARHSWLSEYAHVVGFITSSTTTENDIANTTVPAGELPSTVDMTKNLNADPSIEDMPDAPHLARSASVREPSKPHSTVTAVGGLAQKTGTVDQPADRNKTSREAKRRTVQVEYVAPQSSTVRGDPAATRSRARSGSQGADVGPQPPPKPTDKRQAISATPTAMPPPVRPSRDQQRAASESVTQSGQRPSTGGSMTGSSRLPSRGNSYGQPAVSVTQEQATGRFAQPKKQRYTISPPNQQEQAFMESSILGDRQRPAQEPFEQEPRPAKRDTFVPRSHKRTSTLGEKIGTIFGRSSMSYEQKQVEKAEKEKTKKHPPMAMKHPFTAENGTADPRKSTESRRTSFSFTRKNTDQSATKPSTAKHNRRFSLIQTIKGIGGKESPQQPPGSAGSVDRRGAPQSATRPRLLFHSDSRSTSHSTTNSNSPNQYEDRHNQRPMLGGPTSAPAIQSSTANPYAYHNGFDGRPSGNDPFVTSISGPLTLQQQPPPEQDAPYRPGQYPQGFNEYDDFPARNRSGRLQKHKRFTDAYDNNERAGGSGAPRRVMDFFRRMGARRQGEDR